MPGCKSKELSTDNPLRCHNIPLAGKISRFFLRTAVLVFTCYMSLAAKNLLLVSTTARADPEMLEMYIFMMQTAQPMLGACSACFGSNPSSETTAVGKDTENTKTLSKNWVLFAEQKKKKKNGHTNKGS